MNTRFAAGQSRTKAIVTLATSLALAAAGLGMGVAAPASSGGLQSLETSTPVEVPRTELRITVPEMPDGIRAWARVLGPKPENSSKKRFVKVVTASETLELDPGTYRINTTTKENSVTRGKAGKRSVTFTMLQVNADHTTDFIVPPLPKDTKAGEPEVTIPTNENGVKTLVEIRGPQQSKNAKKKFQATLSSSKSIPVKPGVYRFTTTKTDKTSSNSKPTVTSTLIKVSKNQFTSFAVPSENPQPMAPMLIEIPNKTPGIDISVRVTGPEATTKETRRTDKVIEKSETIIVPEAVYQLAKTKVDSTSGTPVTTVETTSVSVEAGKSVTFSAAPPEVPVTPTEDPTPEPTVMPTPTPTPTPTPIPTVETAPKPTFAVTYALGGGTGTLPTQAAIAAGATFTVATNSLTQAGYTFAVWTDGTTVYAAGSTYTMGSTAVTLTVTLTATNYSITYNSNGATSGTVPTSGNFTTGGSAYSIASNTGTLAKTGSTFGGWNTAADGSGTSYAAGSTYSLQSDLVLFAKWTSCATGGGEAGSCVVGNTGPGGGKVFYVNESNSTGSRYLEVAPTDQGRHAWRDDTSNDLDGTSGDIGTGKANTQRMIDTSKAVHCTSGAAVEAMAYTSENGTNDWFLPSKQELVTLNAASLVDSSLLPQTPRIFNFTWSSTQNTTPSPETHAEISNLNTPANGYAAKGSPYYVIPVRAF